MTAAVIQIRDQRIESRIPVALHVKVSPEEHGADAQLVCSYEISKNGCRLTLPRLLLTANQTVWLIRKNRKALYTVVWVGLDHTDRRGQIGLQSIGEGICIWDEELRQQLWNAA
jgi:hypothetical protein